MTTPRTITLAWLEEQAACAGALAVFRSMFGESAELTRANLLRATTHPDLSMDWLAEHVLTGDALATYKAAIAPAWATYEAATAPALATYEAAFATAWATYKAATAPAWATYRAAKAHALATYEAAFATAWATYKAATAPALADALGLPLEGAA